MGFANIGGSGGSGNYVPKAHIDAITGAVCEVTVEDNHEYRLGEIDSLDILLPNNVPDDYAALIRFTSGETPPALAYDDFLLKGDDVTVDSDEYGEYYVFSPQPNTRYDIGIEYDGEYVKGSVSGTVILDDN